MNFQIREIKISQTQRAILIESWVSVPTKTQSTNINVNIDNQNLEPSIVFPVALFRYFVAFLAEIKRLQNEPGPFTLKTSNFSQGVLKFW